MKEKNEMPAKRVNDSRSVMTELVMPNDTNPMGNLMGGYLMRWMDIASAICAGKHCEAHVVTVAVDYISFQNPIHLGDVITLEASVTRAFHTSVEIYVEVFANDIKGQHPRRCNHAYFTFVALDDKRKNPVPIPPVLPLPVILSGGLDAQNVVQAIERVRPWAVDVSSGVEASRGIKDAAKIASFVAGVRDADSRRSPV